MELNETVELMNSADYKDRFKADEPTCPREIYDLQLDSMKKYMDVLVDNYGVSKER